MNSRIPLVYQIQEADKIIWIAENDMDATWEQIYEAYHYRAELWQEYEYVMTPWRNE